MNKGQPYELLLDGPSGAPPAPALPPQPPVERFRRKTSSSGVLSLTDVLPGLKAGAAKPPKLTAQAQLAASTQARQKDKFVPLPQALEATEDTTDESVSEVDEPARITVYCLAEGFQRKQLEILLARLYKGHSITKYSDVIQLSMTDGRVTQDAFFFDFGVVITFGLDKEQETTLLEQVVYNVQINAYSAEMMEVDNFRFIYSATEPPHIKNDCFTINKRQAKTHSVRLAIAHALAQSSKLSVYEAQVWTLAEDTKPLPEGLAETGRVPASTKHVAQLIGRVFLQNANVNLLSSVLDTPDFFWSAPDHLQALYERACEYLELQARVEVINARFQVLQEMLDMLRSQQNNFHAARLEYIVIWLLVVDCILMLFQLLSLFGVIGGSW